MRYIKVKKLIKKDNASDSVKVHGFYRVNITQDVDGKPRIIGDSGWNKNQVTNLGFDQYLCQTLAGAAGSKTVSHVALGTGTIPAAADTNLNGEVNHTNNDRKTLSTSTIASKTIQFTAAFNSADSFLTASANISNIGLFNVSSVTAGTMFAGQTYGSSAVATNQNVKHLRQLLETVVRKFRKFGGYLDEIFETIPSQALAYC